MGILDNYFTDLKKELQRVNDGINKVQTSAQNVVQAIDKVENKVNNLPTEQQVSAALKQTINSDNSHKSDSQTSNSTKQ